MLEAASQHRQHTARLAMEAAPEADHFGVPGARLRQAQGRLDRLGAARVELAAVQVARSELREQLHQRRAVLRREAPDVNAGDLPLQPGHVLGMGIAEARDTDAGEQVDVAIAIGVVEDGALAAVDAESAEQRDALGAGGEVPRLRLELGLGLRPGEPDVAQGMRHGRFRWAKRCVM